MSRLSARRIRISVGSTFAEDLRVTFKVVKNSGKEPNTCEAAVYNLAEGTRSSFANKGTKIVLEAGYDSTIAQIFAGDTRQIDHAQEGPDWITKLLCGDGERAYRWARVNASFSPGTSRLDVFRRVADEMGLDARAALSTVAQIGDQFSQGFTAWGKASSVVDRLLAGTGFDWSIQDGRLQVLKKGEATKDTAVLLHPDTGLIGTPTFSAPDAGGDGKKKKPPVLKARSLLQPTLQPGGKVQVDSISIRGTFKILTVTHAGDTHGGDWYSDIEATAL